MEENHVYNAAQEAEAASRVLGGLSRAIRDRAVLAMAEALESERDVILAANAEDLEAAQDAVAAGRIGRAAVQRLHLETKLPEMARSLRAVAAAPDPLNRILSATRLDEELELFRMTCPIGVVAMIFESRPDVMTQIASLCLKSGNALLLKGGSEAAKSNRALADVMQQAVEAAAPDVPQGWLTLLETREETAALLGLHEFVDLVVPRGSNAFVRHVMDNTRIPVLGHRDGVCHTYVHEAADPEKAIRIVVDAKCQYPAVCNATETLLIDRGAARRFLAPLATTLARRGVEMRVDDDARDLLLEAPPEAGAETIGEGGAAPPFARFLRDAEEEDWSTEHLDLTLSIAVVDGIEEAVAHVNHYGSGHTDAIVTEDARAAAHFMNAVDSASVLHNASTRFADGYRYGLGAEVGISTEKVHWRGPVGLEGLTIHKYLVRGAGHVVADYVGEGAREFLHERIDLPGS